MLFSYQKTIGVWCRELCRSYVVATGMANTFLIDLLIRVRSEGQPHLLLSSGGMKLWSKELTDLVVWKEGAGLMHRFLAA